MVSAATLTAVSAYLDPGPRRDPRLGLDRDDSRDACTSSRTSTKSSGNGWHSGISSPVRFAGAMTPAIRAVARTSPFAIALAAIFFAVAGSMRTAPRATATRCVTGFVADVHHARAALRSTCVRRDATGLRRPGMARF